MTWRNVRQAIRETVSADPHSGAPPGGRRALREGRSTHSIGRALRRLHEPVADEPLPQDFVALLNALDAADRRNRA